MSNAYCFFLHMSVYKNIFLKLVYHIAQYISLSNQERKFIELKMPNNNGIRKNKKFKIITSFLTVTFNGNASQLAVECLNIEYS